MQVRLPYPRGPNPVTDRSVPVNEKISNKICHHLFCQPTTPTKPWWRKQTARMFEFCNFYDAVILYCMYKCRYGYNGFLNDWLNVENSVAVYSRALSCSHSEFSGLSFDSQLFMPVCVFCLNQKKHLMTWNFPVHHSAAQHLYVQHQGGATVIYFQQAWDVFVSLQLQTSRWLWRCLHYEKRMVKVQACL